MNKQANATAKSKELQPKSQTETKTPHLILPNRTAIYY
jgi:hypothetical protein